MEDPDSHHAPSYVRENKVVPTLAKSGLAGEFRQRFRSERKRCLFVCHIKGIASFRLGQPPGC
ncbi:MAG: hypothetical protein H5T64_01805 [Chloroflexi bacterium]|nr:hypothetical protein [Chloroflexota bacterium]